MLDRIRKFFGLESPGKAESAAVDFDAPPPFEYRIVHGKRVAEEMDALRRTPGVVPVLFGDRETFDEVLDHMTLNDGDFEDLLAAGVELDVDAWMEERVSSDPGFYEIDETMQGTPEGAQLYSPAREHGTDKFVEELFIGLVPVNVPWHVPAYLKAGGWNECPDPIVQVAFFKRWHEQYGAEVATITRDVIEFRVSRPPSTSHDAMVLAREQFIYCNDIVHQGVNTVGNLSATLFRSPNWFFWWD